LDGLNFFVTVKIATACEQRLSHIIQSST
jgi:hypothetical protein